MTNESRQSSWLKSAVPILEWLPNYKLSLLRWDVIAGITLAAYAVPVSLAYASLAGLPPQFGIYCYLVAGMFYAVLGSSRQLAVGPTSAISLMVGSTVAVLSGGDPSRWIAIAALTAFAVGVVSLIAYLFKLSSLVNFISETILLGFKAGAAFTIAMTQLPKLFGVKGGGEFFFERLHILIQQLGETNLTVLAFGLIALAVLLIGNRLFPGRPIALLVVIASIVVVSFTELASHGIKIAGELPQGLPPFSKPALGFKDVDGVFGLALACFLLAYIESISAARTLSQKNNYSVNARQELLALGAANIATAFSSGFPVAGGLSQSSVNDKAGAKTQLALVVSSITLAVLLLFFTGLLKNLPTVVLAAVVLDAVTGLVKVKELKRLRQLSKFEFGIAMIAFVGVLLFGILKGILLAVILSLILLIRRTAHPHVAVLGKIPGTDRYSDIERNSGNTLIEGVLIFRVEASIIYFNVESVNEDVWKHIGATGEKLKLVILDLSSSPYVDVSGTNFLLQLNSELKKRNIQFRMVEARARVRDILRDQELETATGAINRRISLNDIVEEFEKGR